MLESNIGWMIGGFFSIAMGFVALWRPGGPCCPTIGFCGVFAIAYGLLRQFAPDFHPIRRTLGQHGDADRLASKINRELSDDPIQIGKLFVTETYLVMMDPYGFDFIRRDSIVRIYPLTLIGRRSGFYLVFIAEPRQEFIVKAKSFEGVLELMAEMSKLLPEVRIERDAPG